MNAVTHVICSGLFGMVWGPCAYMAGMAVYDRFYYRGQFKKARFWGWATALGIAVVCLGAVVVTGIVLVET